MIFIDFETRSRCDLRLHGGRRYAADPSTEVLCGVALDTRRDPAELYVWSPFDVELRHWRPDDAVLEALNTPADAVRYMPPRCMRDDEFAWWSLPLPIAAARTKATFVAHNADGFDKHIGDRFGLAGATWLDSVHRCRRRSLPGALDKIGTQLYGLGKDKGGHRIMKRLAIPQKNGAFREPVSATMSALVRYCIRDVFLLAAIWFDEGLGDDHVDDEVLRVHRVINERGACVDVAAAERLIAASEALKAEAIASAPVSSTMLNSPVALRRWLAARGCELPDIQASSIEACLKCQ